MTKSSKITLFQQKNKTVQKNIRASIQIRDSTVLLQFVKASKKRKKKKKKKSLKKQKKNKTNQKNKKIKSPTRFSELVCSYPHPSGFRKTDTHTQTIQLSFNVLDYDRPLSIQVEHVENDRVVAKGLVQILWDGIFSTKTSKQHLIFEPMVQCSGNVSFHQKGMSSKCPTLLRMARNMRYKSSGFSVQAGYLDWRRTESAAIGLAVRYFEHFGVRNWIFDSSLSFEFPKRQVVQAVQAPWPLPDILALDETEATIGYYEPNVSQQDLESKYKNKLAPSFELRKHFRFGPKADFVFGTIYFRCHILLCFHDAEQGRIFIVNSKNENDAVLPPEFEKSIWKKLACKLFGVEHPIFECFNINCQRFNDCSIWTAILPCYFLRVIGRYDKPPSADQIKQILVNTNWFRVSESLFKEFVQRLGYYPNLFRQPNKMIRKHKRLQPNFDNVSFKGLDPATLDDESRSLVDQYVQMASTGTCFEQLTTDVLETVLHSSQVMLLFSGKKLVFGGYAFMDWMEVFKGYSIQLFGLCVNSKQNILNYLGLYLQKTIAHIKSNELLNRSSYFIVTLPGCPKLVCTIMKKVGFSLRSDFKWIYEL